VQFATQFAKPHRQNRTGKWIFELYTFSRISLVHGFCKLNSFFIDVHKPPFDDFVKTGAVESFAGIIMIEISNMVISRWMPRASFSECYFQTLTIAAASFQ
jgi:hypothetical protein